MCVGEMQGDRLCGRFQISTHIPPLRGSDGPAKTFGVTMQNFSCISKNIGVLLELEDSSYPTRKVNKKPEIQLNRLLNFTK